MSISEYLLFHERQEIEEQLLLSENPGGGWLGGPSSLRRLRAGCVVSYNFNGECERRKALTVVVAVVNIHLGRVYSNFTSSTIL